MLEGFARSESRECVATKQTYNHDIIPYMTAYVETHGEDGVRTGNLLGTIGLNSATLSLWVREAVMGNMRDVFGLKRPTQPPDEIVVGEENGFKVVPVLSRDYEGVPRQITQQTPEPVTGFSHRFHQYVDVWPTPAPKK